MRFIAVLSMLLLSTGTTWAVDSNIVMLPDDAVANALNYLANRPYREVAPIIAGLQRCLQDQIPDDRGMVAAKGACPEMTLPLRRLNTPLPHEPPPQ